MIDINEGALALAAEELGTTTKETVDAALALVGVGIGGSKRCSTTRTPSESAGMSTTRK